MDPHLGSRFGSGLECQRTRDNRPANVSADDGTGYRGVFSARRPVKKLKGLAARLNSVEPEASRTKQTACDEAG